MLSLGPSEQCNFEIPLVLLMYFLMEDQFYNFGFFLCVCYFRQRKVYFYGLGHSCLMPVIFALRLEGKDMRKV